MQKQGKSRCGLHREGKTLLGAYVTEETKAIVIMTADRLGITMSDIIINGLRSEAERAGVLVNGQVPDELKPTYEAILEMVHVANVGRAKK